MGNVSKRWNKREIFTIPNLMSLIRLFLIPIIMWLYLGKNDHVAAAVVILISAATDVADGFIARTFHMVSEVGKFIDPVADKLTQGAICVCLGISFWQVWVLMGLMAIKEALMLSVGLMILRRNDKINSAQWYGKACTAIIELSFMFLVVWGETIPRLAVDIIIYVLMAVVVITLILYMRFYAKQLKGPAPAETEE